MLHTIWHTVLDTIKLMPFLFIAFLIMEYLEHKVNKKTNILTKSKLGPFFGSLLGVIPQCGFSLVATNLFSSKVITMGTLLAVYLSTSDEMVPLLIANNVKGSTILILLIIKIIVAIGFGYLIDLLFKKSNLLKKDFSICESDECNCNKGIVLSSLIHTLKISLYVYLATLILNLLVHYLGLENLSFGLLKNDVFGPFISSLIGLIPNCAASVILTELYLKGVITSGMLIGGLLTGAGSGLLLLFKLNKKKKENLLIVLLLYGIGVLVGIFLNLINISL